MEKHGGNLELTLRLYKIAENTFPKYLDNKWLDSIYNSLDGYNDNVTRLEYLNKITIIYTREYSYVLFE